MTPVVRKIPEPMMTPITIKVESRRPSPRTSSGADSLSVIYEESYPPRPACLQTISVARTSPRTASRCGLFHQVSVLVQVSHSRAQEHIPAVDHRPVDTHRIESGRDRVRVPIQILDGGNGYAKFVVLPGLLVIQLGATHVIGFGDDEVFLESARLEGVELLQDDPMHLIDGLLDLFRFVAQHLQNGDEAHHRVSTRIGHREDGFAVRGNPTGLLPTESQSLADGDHALLRSDDETADRGAAGLVHAPHHHVGSDVCWT